MGGGLSPREPSSTSGRGSKNPRGLRLAWKRNLQATVGPSGSRCSKRPPCVAAVTGSAARLAALRRSTLAARLPAGVSGAPPPVDASRPPGRGGPLSRIPRDPFAGAGASLRGPKTRPGPDRSGRRRPSRVRCAPVACDPPCGGPGRRGSGLLAFTSTAWSDANDRTVAMTGQLRVCAGQNTNAQVSGVEQKVTIPRPV
jgi:hypothetical protein